MEWNDSYMIFVTEQEQHNFSKHINLIGSSVKIRVRQIFKENLYRFVMEDSKDFWLFLKSMVY